MSIIRALVCLAFFSAVVWFATPAIPARAAATVGSIAGVVTDTDGNPIYEASITAFAPSGRYVTRSDLHGRFLLLGVVPDSYTITISAANFVAVTQHISVYPDARVDVSARLEPEVRTLGRTVVRASSLGIGRTVNQFTIIGTQASAERAISPAGLSSYVRGTVQGALSNVAGLTIDPFGDALVRGAKADETAYTYDGVPLLQAEVAEPGGNPIGAALATTGVAYTNVNAGAFSVADPNALSGVVDEVAAIGTHPGRYSITLGNGLEGRALDFDVLGGWADPNLSTRSFLAFKVFSDAIDYGDRQTFYGAEAGTYGLALHNQGGWNGVANLHTLWHNTDVQLLTFGGQTAYNLYGTPFSGETYGSFGPYTGAASPTAPVMTPTRVRGNYGVEKIQFTHNHPHALSRIKLYASNVGSKAFGPFWDDLSFPNGAISLASTTGYTAQGAAIDIDDVANSAHEIRYGLNYDHQHFDQAETVPIVPEVLTSAPRIDELAAYIADIWDLSSAIKFDFGLRLDRGIARRSDGLLDNFSALDPRGSIAWRLGPKGENVVRLSAGDFSQAPQPLEIERIVRIGTQPTRSFAPLAPERAANYELSFGHGGTLTYKLTGFSRREENLVDVIPTNFKAPLVVSGTAGASTGVALPQNVGEALINGAELDLQDNGFNVAATYLHGRSSSASQYGLNDLNAPAAAAGHLFPLSYVPAVQVTASYDRRWGKLELGPSLTYESGYPFGNGKKVFIYCAAVSFDCPQANGRPAQVPNDNNINPGYNYYFLADPRAPYCPLASGCAGGTAYNPFVATLGTHEGDDPYTLTSPPAWVLGLHIGYRLTQTVTAQLEISNLLDDITPNQYVSNPYLIGPPGYTGAASCSTPTAQYYGGPNGVGSGCYTLGNGIPTLNGTTQALPWTYGTGAYVPSSYPAPRTIYLHIAWSNV